jgi:hypothetical protein
MPLLGGGLAKNREIFAKNVIEFSAPTDLHRLSVESFAATLNVGAFRNPQDWTQTLRTGYGRNYLDCCGIVGQQISLLSGNTDREDFIHPQH